MEIGSQTPYHRLIDRLVDYAICALDPNGTVVGWNRVAERIYGFAADDIVGRHFSTFYSDGDVAAGEPARELEVAAREGSAEVEGWRVRKDGSRFSAHVIVTAIYAEGGELSGFAAVTRGPAERRGIQDALRPSEEEFGLLVQSVQDYAILMLDTEGRVTSWNTGAERIKGYTAEEIIGRSFTAFYPQEAVESGFPKHELRVAAATGRFEDENWRIRKDGSRFWANVVITALRNDSGELVGFAKVTRDLTARREAEKQAQRLAAEEAAHAEAMRRNAELEALNGQLQEQAAELEALNEQLQEQATELEAQAVELEAQTEELAAMTEELRQTNVELQEALASAETAREKAERAAAAATDAYRELDQFAYVASHDLKAPLRGIANLAQWIQDDLGASLAGDSAAHLALLQGRVRRMEALIDGILAYSRAGRIVTQPETIDTGALAREIVELLAPARNVTVHVADEMPGLIGERVPLEQVLMNLIDNAAKYGGAEGAEANVWVDWRDAGDAVEFAVRDDGPGIAPEYHERIWAIFQTLAARDKVEGTGIGLSVVKKIVETRGGRVWVESLPGQGATFRFTWPKQFKGSVA